MKRGLKITLVTLLVLIGMASYYISHPKKALNIIIPKFENIEKISITLLKDTALIDADVLFENKSFFKLSIDSLIYNIKLDTLTLLSKAQDLRIRLSPSQADTVNLPIALPFKRLMKEIKHLQKQDSVSITFDLRVVYSTWLGKTVLPYKKIIIIAVPVPPKFEIEKFEYKKHRNHEFYFNADVKIINKGKLDLHISDVSYTIVVKDNFRATGKDLREIHLNPRSEMIVVLPIKITFEHLFKTLIKVVTNNDKVKYDLKIHLRAQMDKLSPEKTEIDIEKEGITELKK